MLNLCDIVLGYHNKALTQNISLTLSAGEICAVIGHNGAGKSTLVRTILGLQPPLSGRVEWQNGLENRIAYLGQNSNFDSRFPLRIIDVVGMGAWKDLGFWGRVDLEKTTRIDQALERTGLEAMALRPLYECSAGQLQRCFFARAIVQNAPLILLDEPFLAVDQTTEAKLIQIIEGWRDEGRALMIVLHDLSTVMTLADKCLLLGAGKAIYGAAEAIVTKKNLIAHKYLSEIQADWLNFLHEQEDRGDDARMA